MRESLRSLCFPLLMLTVVGGVSVSLARGEEEPPERQHSAAEQGEPPNPEAGEATDAAQPEAAAPESNEQDGDDAQEASAAEDDAEAATAGHESGEAEDGDGDGEDEGSGDPEMDRLQRSDQEFEKTTSDLVEKHKSASTPADREAARSELLEAVNRHFDLRQEIRARELAELEKQIAELRRSLDRRTQLRDKIVQRRMTELLGDETEDLDF